MKNESFKAYDEERLDVETINQDINNMYTQADLPITLSDVQKLTKCLNILHKDKRAPWLYRLYEIDVSLGTSGYGFKFQTDSKPMTFSFFQLKKYDPILRPIKYVYLPFGMSSIPALSSRDIAENACAYVEMCMKIFLFSEDSYIYSKDTMGGMLYNHRLEFDENTFLLIKQLNDCVYKKTKHQFNIDYPRKQLLTLSESLASYFICRKVGLKLLETIGIVEDMENEIKRSSNDAGVLIGQTWYV